MDEIGLFLLLDAAVDQLAWLILGHRSPFLKRHRQLLLFQPHCCAKYSLNSLTNAPCGPVKYAVARTVTGSVADTCPPRA
jgi:hypothetical protein